MRIKPISLYAAYLNMAQNNVRTTLSYIYEAITQKYTKASAGQLLNMIKNAAANNAETHKRVLALFDKHFPFIKPMISKNNLSPFDQMKEIMQELDALRNEYTHTKHREGQRNQSIIRGMKEVFDAGKHTIKDRLTLTEADASHLNRCIKDSSTRKIIENPAFHYKFDDANGDLTNKGLAFFICMFLEKRYADLLLAQIKGSKSTYTKSDRATKEVYSAYRLLLPKSRIDVKEPAMALGLDMLNELKKCPKELWELLTPEEQNRFRVPINSEDAANSMEALLKRSNDRFPIFAMKYIDQMQSFKELRFQVSLGTYRFKFYDKVTVDAIKKVRILQKRLYGYGRLNDMEEHVRKDKDVFGSLIREHDKVIADTAASEPYITDSKAQYIISNNRIGLHLGDYTPMLDTALKEPDCWLSIYEIPPMLFHILLSDGMETESIIKRYVTNYRKLFQDIAGGILTPEEPDTKDCICHVLKDRYKLDFKHIPVEMQNYLTNNLPLMKEEFIRLSEKRVYDMREETRQRIYGITRDCEIIEDKKRNKIGKKRYVEIKSGKLADFLAEDMMRFQPSIEKGKDKITGANYQTLQASIAYYGLYKEDMERIFRNCKLIDSEIAHPFLKNVLNTHPVDTVAFYKAYLKERLCYLEKCIVKRNYKGCAFLHADRIRWQERNADFYRKLASRYLQQPIDLPRGLFTEHIKDKLQKEKTYTTNPKLQESLSHGRVNASYMIKEWFHYLHNDENQEFYNFKRNYKVFDRLINKRGCKRPQKFYYSHDEFKQKAVQVKTDMVNYLSQYSEEEHEKEKHIMDRLLRQYTHTEKLIRLYSVEDMLLFRMAKNILASEPEIDRYKLKEIMPDSENDILSIQTPIQVEAKFNGQTYILKQDDLKIKNYGDFKRFLHDNRIPSLLKFYSTPNIPLDRKVLEAELKSYDEQRVEVFKLLHEFEKIVLEDKTIDMNGLNYLEFKEVLNYSTLQDDETDLLKTVRNAFCHNQYPEPDKVNSVCTASDFPHITKKLIKYINDTVIA